MSAGAELARIEDRLAEINSGGTAALPHLPVLLNQSRAALAEIVSVADALDAEKRAAKIAEFAALAEWPVPIINNAELLRYEAGVRLAELIEEGQARGEIAAKGRPEKRSGVRTFGEIGVERRRLAEFRKVRDTGALELAREQFRAEPGKPLYIAELVRRTEKEARTSKLRAQRTEAEAEARAAGRRIEIELADVRSWRPSGVSQIITDPPYITDDAIELYSALADFALDVLPEGGALVCLCWGPIQHDVHLAMDRPGLLWRAPLAWLFDEGANTQDFRRRMFDSWKPVLVWHKGRLPDEASWCYDRIKSPGKVLAEGAGRLDNPGEAHRWEQALEPCKQLVEWFSKPGETVCDPFCGSGTQAVAAVALARDFIGADTNPAHVETARRRLGLA